jgi:hypothetical protein
VPARGGGGGGGGPEPATRADVGAAAAAPVARAGPRRAVTVVRRLPSAFVHLRYGTTAALVMHRIVGLTAPRFARSLRRLRRRTPRHFGRRVHTKFLSDVRAIAAEVAVAVDGTCSCVCVRGSRVVTHAPSRVTRACAAFAVVWRICVHNAGGSGAPERACTLMCWQAPTVEIMRMVQSELVRCGVVAGDGTEHERCAAAVAIQVHVYTLSLCLLRSPSRADACVARSQRGVRTRAECTSTRHSPCESWSSAPRCVCSGGRGLVAPPCALTSWPRWLVRPGASRCPDEPWGTRPLTRACAAL